MAKKKTVKKKAVKKKVATSSLSAKLEKTIDKDFQAFKQLVRSGAGKNELAEKNCKRMAVWQDAAEAGDARGQVLYYFGHGVKEEEFVELLNDEVKKQAFWKLPLDVQAKILHLLIPQGSEVANKLDELSRRIDGWFRKMALKEAAKTGLSEQDADNIVKAWTLEEE